MNENKERKRKWLRILLVVFSLAILFVAIFLVLHFTGLLDKLNSVDKVRELIQTTGFWGKLIFVVLQFLQVTFIPIPSTILTIAGAIVFGPLQGSLLSLAGILFGSSIAFLLGRTCGKKLVAFMVGQEICDKWTGILSKAKYSFFIMMLLPMFPDDVLCLVAGLTNMTWRFFIITNLITRPIGIFWTSYLGSGEIIPYSGWGLIVWVILIIIALIGVYLSIKYQQQIENFIVKKFQNKDKKNKT